MITRDGRHAASAAFLFAAGALTMTLSLLALPAPASAQATGAHHAHARTRIATTASSASARHYYRGARQEEEFTPLGGWIEGRTLNTRAEWQQAFRGSIGNPANYTPRAESRGNWPAILDPWNQWPMDPLRYPY